MSCHEPEVQVQARDGEQNAVENVKQAAHAGDDAPGILDVRGALEERFSQVADNRAHAQEDAQRNGPQRRDVKGAIDVTQAPRQNHA